MLAVAWAVTEKYDMIFFNPLSHIIRTPDLPFTDNFYLDLSYLLKAFADLRNVKSYSVIWNPLHSQLDGLDLKMENIVYSDLHLY